MLRRIVILFFLPVIAKAGSGIHFEQALNWSQVKDKAVKEHKYIFLDCFTTWCGPCKLMDREVYSHEEVGDYFNAHFICVKLQMDKTNADNAEVRTLYDDAEFIQKHYGIPAYPTFLFFSPDAKLIYRDVGFKSPTDFLIIGKKYSGEIKPINERYYSLIDSYQQGQKDCDVMPFLIDTSNILGQHELADNIARDYMHYLWEGKDDVLYTRPAIKVLASYTMGSKSKFFDIFYLHGELVDSIMGEQGFAHLVVERIINQEDVIPFAHLNTGMSFTGPVEEKPEPDWQLLTNNLKAKYGDGYADHLVTVARIKWYSDQKNWSNCTKWFTILAKGYPIENDEQTHLFINSIAGVVFKWSLDKEQIDAAIIYMKSLLDVSKTDGVFFFYMDTYANLLYKADRKNEAIELEKIALKGMTNEGTPSYYVQMVENTLKKMNTGQPTWPHYILKTSWP